MAQANNPNAHGLGAPGPIGAPQIYLFADVGNPNTRADPQGLLANCSLGSLYTQTDSVAFWQKTGAASASAPTGVWVQIS